MSDKNTKLTQLEKEFREALLSELRDIKVSQNLLKNDFEKLDKNLSITIERVKSEIAQIHNLDEAQNKMLDEHIKRSNALEEMLQSIRDKELEPIKKHVYMMEGALKLIGLIGVLVGIGAGIAKILSLVI